MPAPPVQKMPLISASFGYLLKSTLDAMSQRIDELGMINRALNGDLVVQVPTVGGKSTELFTVDRLTLRIEGGTTLAGAWEVPVRTVTVTTVIQSTDHTLLCDATGAAFTVYLPAANLVPGRIYAIKKTDVTANAVTIDPNGAELIDGAGTNVIAAQWDGRIIQSSGTAWFILANI